MDIHHIRYLLAVCETRNFTRAAEKCNVTQPALSRAIQQLEDEVGGLLFRRERNLTHITDLGNLLRPRFQQVLDELMGVKKEASMFLWAPIPDRFRHLGSVGFSKLLLEKAKVAVAPGLGFGEHGDEHVRIALVENEHRIRQAARNVKRFLASSAGGADNVVPLAARR